MLKDFIKPVEPFYLHDGRVIRRLSELIKILDDIDDNIFSEHVNDWKNDFYAWIKDCISDDIAEIVKHKKTKHEMKEALLLELLREVEFEVE